MGESLTLQDVALTSVGEDVLVSGYRHLY
jgi:hypothetical protein